MPPFTTDDFKLEIIDNALVITNVTNAYIAGEYPARDIFFDAEELRESKISLYDTNGTTKKGSLVLLAPLDNVVDSGDVTFTDASFRAFCRSSLGFSSVPGGSGTLEETLNNGPNTGPHDIIIDNDQVVKAANGNSFINPRFGGSDNLIRIGGGSDYLDIGNGQVTMSFGAAFVDPYIGLTTMNSGGLGFGYFKGDFSKFATFGIITNDGIDALGGGNGAGAYPMFLGCNQSIITDGVGNSNLLAGDGVIGRSDNTGYLQFLGFNTGEDGQIRIAHTPDGANNHIATLQPKTGDIALTSDIKTQSQPFVFTRNNFDFIQENSNTYVSVAKITYAGTNTLGVPTKIISNVWNDGGTSVSIRVVDITNAQVIAELTGITSANDFNLENLGTLSNLPLLPALFQIELLQNGGGMGDNAKISSLTIY